MLDGLFRFRRYALDRANYFVTLARLRVLDWLAGPEPETEADKKREAERERLRKAFPRVNFDHKPQTVPVNEMAPVQNHRRYS
jgi:hypothetical protein